ncbi:M56 family metallopeptidase [Pseudoxanthomonas sp. PXM02]|uniref:M56 family metallopeptidase n=1 Tax=Pseudoxanthomonas sp. PXM02 TaxID=2769294 RepID=UPI0017829806|nr:M56 family metallopeptidase [Pseudoxanthomonas sp. PXM02]MBD9480882.1 hypothetical protein [Pseudoxanthomonas sp. PXM02]
MDLVAFADAVMDRLLAVGLQSLMLAALVWALCRYLPRLDARTRAWLWWLVATQMVVGLVWHAPVALPLLPAESVTVPVATITAASLPATMATASATTALDLSAPVMQESRFDLGVLLLAAWLAGIAVMLANTLRHAWRLRGQIERARPCRDRRARAVYHTLVRRLDVAAAPVLLVSDEIDSPMLARPWRPVLMLPAANIAGMGDDDLHMVLHHELAHLQRRDLWWAWMPALAQHLFFFHPVAHLAAREYGFAREVACDAVVLADEHHAAHDYGRLLVKLGVSPASAPALAGASPTFRILKRRLMMLQSTDSPLREGALVLIIGIMALAVIPYRVTARTAPVVPPVVAPAATPTPAPVADPVIAPTPTAAPQPVLVAAATDMPAPPAPPAPPKVAVPAPPAPPPAPKVTPPSPPPPPALRMSGTMSIGNSRNGDAYVLIDGDDVTMAGHSDDIRTAQRLQQGNAPVIWVRKNGKQYVVRDAATVQQMKAAHAPVQALGEQQGKLGEQQGALGERQGELGSKQGELGEKMSEIATGQAAAALRGDATRDAANDRRMKALQDEQEALARQQEVLARQQEPLARQQEALARKQMAATDKMHRDVDRLLGEAIRSGKAQQL